MKSLKIETDSEETVLRLALEHYAQEMMDTEGWTDMDVNTQLRKLSHTSAVSILIERLNNLFTGDMQK